MDAAVASGHPRTTRAAVDVLTLGGNAFDAVVAAGFLSSVAEPLLTSLAGGGFCLVRPAGGGAEVVDFFVDVPTAPVDPSSMETVQIAFAGATQVFHCGWASAAVPGCARGWLHVHRRHGRLPLRDVLAPAIAASAGVRVTAEQARLVALLAPIVSLSADVAARFLPDGRPLQEGDTLAQPEVGAFLRRLAKDPSAALGTLDAGLAAAGPASVADLDAYQVAERSPLTVRYRDRTVLLTPSAGGVLVAAALRWLDGGPSLRGWDDASGLARLVGAQLAADAERVPMATRGTTHVSVIDRDGNVASMTSSNGSGAGCAVPGIGVLCNNMLGEEDLFPAGLGSGRGGTRVPSMMSPVLVLEGDEPVLALGSGGSARIPTAITQVVARTVDHEGDLPSAVGGPRAHHDGAVVQVEGGHPPGALSALALDHDLNEWTSRDLYFGGVHAVGREVSSGRLVAASDPRRGGSAWVG